MAGPHEYLPPSGIEERLTRLHFYAPLTEVELGAQMDLKASYLELDRQVFEVDED